MAMFIHNRIWQNKINRTLIFSIFVVIWTLLIEFYFLFWPMELIKENVFVSWLYFDFFGYTFLLDLFHTVIWGISFFFTWLAYTIFKDISNSGEATVSEFIYILAIFTFFIIFLNNIFIAGLFLLVGFSEFFYMYFALSNEL